MQMPQINPPALAYFDPGAGSLLLQALVGLVREGLVTEEDAKLASTTPHDFVLELRGSTNRALGIAGAAP